MSMEMTFRSLSNVGVANEPLNRAPVTVTCDVAEQNADICVSNPRSQRRNSRVLADRGTKTASAWQPACEPPHTNILSLSLSAEDMVAGNGLQPYPSCESRMSPVDGYQVRRCPFPTVCDQGDSAGASIKEIAALSESEDEPWDLSPSGTSMLFLTGAETDESTDTISANSSFDDAAIAHCGTSADERACLVKRLRAERMKRFPNATHLTMEDVRKALSTLPSAEEVDAQIQAGATITVPLPHPFLDLRDQRARVAVDRWHRQSAEQQQQQRSAALSRMDAYISCKMLVGAAHAHHVDWLRRQHAHVLGLSHEEMDLLKDSISFEWARLGQQVEEHLMFTECAVVLRRLSCACLFDPDSDVRQYGDMEESRARRVARQREVLAHLGKQKQSGLSSLFVQS